MNKIVWTAMEDERIREQYAVKSIAEMVSLFPGRSYDQLRNRVRNLGLVGSPKAFTRKVSRGNYKTWSEDETQILMDCYALDSMDELRAKLPNKSKMAIYSHAFSLDLKRPKPAKKEAPKQAAELQPADLAIESKVDLQKLEAIKANKQRRGVVEVSPPRPIKMKHWEKQLLMDFGTTLGWYELKALMPLRTKQELIEMARYLRIELQGA